MLVRIDKSKDSSATDSSRWRFAASVKLFTWRSPTAIFDPEKIFRAQEIEAIQDVTAWQGSIIASVDSDAVHLEVAIPGWGAHGVDVQYEPGNYTFENVSIEEDSDGATVRWGAVDVSFGAVDYREEGEGEWLRKDGTRWMGSTRLRSRPSTSTARKKYSIDSSTSNPTERNGTARSVLWRLSGPTASSMNNQDLSNGQTNWLSVSNSRDTVLESKSC